MVIGKLAQYVFGDPTNHPKQQKSQYIPEVLKQNPTQCDNQHPSAFRTIYQQGQVHQKTTNLNSSDKQVHDANLSQLPYLGISSLPTKQLTAARNFPEVENFPTRDIAAQNHNAKLDLTNKNNSFAGQIIAPSDRENVANQKKNTGNSLKNDNFAPKIEPSFNDKHTSTEDFDDVSERNEVLLHQAAGEHITQTNSPLPKADQKQVESSNSKSSNDDSVPTTHMKGPEFVYWSSQTPETISIPFESDFFDLENDSGAGSKRNVVIELSNGRQLVVACTLKSSIQECCCHI